MLTAALIAALLSAVLVDLRHRTFVVAVAEDPRSLQARRAQLRFETWLMTGPAFLLLAAHLA
jgi:hypothetical protein